MSTNRTERIRKLDLLLRFAKWSYASLGGVALVVQHVFGGVSFGISSVFAIVLIRVMAPVDAVEEGRGRWLPSS